jgi:hypothetical protein
MMVARRLHVASVIMAVAAGVLTAACTPGTTTGPGGRVQGTVRAGPACPVERPEHPCPPVPVSGEVRLVQGGTVKARATTDAAGAYVVDAAAGDYLLVVDVGGPFPRCPATSVTVRATATSTIDVDCDTGIR